MWTDSGRGKKEKENAIKDKTLSKQASAEIQEEGKSMRGAKEEAEQKNSQSKQQMQNHEEAEKTGDEKQRLTKR